MPPEEDRATATGDLHKKFVKIGPAVPETHRQTHTHTNIETDKLIAILHSPIGAE